MNRFIVNFGRIVIFLVIQVLICNRIGWFGFLIPQLYILPLLLLPLEISKSLQYLIAFSVGLVVDCFLQTYGIHAMAALILIFIRPYLVLLLNGFKSQDGIFKPIPGIKDFKWLFFYVFFLAFVHQIIITGIETADLHYWFRTIWTSIFNALFTTFFILCCEYLFFNASKKSASYNA